jgi:hypothetical protein
MSKLGQYAPKIRSDAIRCEHAAHSIGCVVKTNAYLSGAVIQITLWRGDECVDVTYSWEKMLEALRLRGAEIISDQWEVTEDEQPNNRYQ